MDGWRIVGRRVEKVKGGLEVPENSSTRVSESVPEEVEEEEDGRREKNPLSSL